MFGSSKPTVNTTSTTRKVYAHHNKQAPIKPVRLLNDPSHTMVPPAALPANIIIQQNTSSAGESGITGRSTRMENSGLPQIW